MGVICISISRAIASCLFYWVHLFVHLRFGNNKGTFIFE